MSNPDYPIGPLGYPLALPRLEVDDDISLQLVTAADGPATYAISADPKNRPFLIDVFKSRPEDFPPQVADQACASQESRNTEGSAASYKVLLGQRFVGMVSLSKRQGDTAELGCWIEKAASGQKVITRAASRLVAEGFDNLGLRRIDIHTNQNNDPSRSLARRLGAAIVGIEQIDDQQIELWRLTNDE